MATRYKIATVEGTQTFTNKTLTSPGVNTPTLVLADTVPTADGSMGFDRTNEDLAIGDGSAGQLVHMGAWKTYAVTVTGFSADPASMVGRYSLIGKTCIYCVYMPNTGTSNSTAFTVSAPFTSANAVAHYITANGQCTDNGAYYGSLFGDLPPNSATITLSRNFGNLGWTAANGKNANFVMIYEIA